MQEEVVLRPEGICKEFPGEKLFGMLSSPSHASGAEMNAIASSIIVGTMLSGGSVNPNDNTR